MTWIRSAFWIGQPQPGKEQELERIVKDDLLPAMQSFPGVKRVTLLWPRTREEHAPAIYYQSLFEFDTREDLERMLQSEERVAIGPRVQVAKALFEGSISHIDYEDR